MPAHRKYRRSKYSDDVHEVWRLRLHPLWLYLLWLYLLGSACSGTEIASSSYRAALRSPPPLRTARGTWLGVGSGFGSRLGLGLRVRARVRDSSGVLGTLDGWQHAGGCRGGDRSLLAGDDEL
eukprot:scaffold47956_cov36-Phaeocystis_antarctica.AAC.1